MADTMTIGRTTQMSPETTHGQAPAGGATKQLVDTILQMDPTFPVTEIRGTGRRYVGIVAPVGQEATAGKLSGGVGYNSIVYFLSMMFGAAVVTTPTGAVNARQWKWTIPLTGSINPTSMDIEQGDTNDADQFLYTICDSFGIDATRASVAPAGTLLARATNHLTPVGSFAGMTSSGVTQLPLLPILPAHWSVFMDFTSTNLGNTKLSRAFHAKWDYGGAFVPFYPLDNAQTSYGGVADGDQVKTTMLIEMMKSVTVDPTGSENLWPGARSGFKRYIRMLAGGLGVSPLIDNIFQLNGSASYTAGNVGYTYKGQAASWAFNATGAQIQTAIQGLSTVGAGNAIVTPSGTAFNTATTFNVTMSGTLAQDSTLPTITTQPTGGTVVITPVQIPASFQLDCAGEVNLAGPNKDFQGLRTREWTFTIVEDPVWGNAIILTVINGLTAGVL